jgi:hypothetical protein
VNRRRRLLLAIVVAVVAAVVLSSGSVARAAPPSDTAPPDSAGVILVNEFLPEEANLGDCISALPRPECGSEARGGWRQAAVFGVIAVALVAIGVRLAIAVRRRDRRLDTSAPRSRPVVE